MVFIGFLIGGTAGALIMAVFSVRTYERGYDDGFAHALRSEDDEQ